MVAVPERVSVLVPAPDDRDAAAGDGRQDIARVKAADRGCHSVRLALVPAIIEARVGSLMLTGCH